LVDERNEVDVSPNVFDLDESKFDVREEIILARVGELGTIVTDAVNCFELVVPNFVKLHLVNASGGFQQINVVIVGDDW
jgi:hypothetical protein